LVVLSCNHRRVVRTLLRNLQRTGRSGSVSKNPIRTRNAGHYTGVPYSIDSLPREPSECPGENCSQYFSKRSDIHNDRDSARFRPLLPSVKQHYHPNRLRCPSRRCRELSVLRFPQKLPLARLEESLRLCLSRFSDESCLRTLER